ncbi:acyl-CoA dehydrogenase family protein [uncultured Phenylobacterium sp.]|uniref:acyl-CoA dehydrogenase family protein n=1 Tax=uncultured Phenylobacterium sp. TaxID=349273 RepID=UPI0025F86A39|nr:acyl-CoA dehydrogenase family protein [uncultured Phenylobacterium sp.]
MAWDFETDPEFQKKLDWIEDFMREEVEPLSHLGMAAYTTLGREKFIKPLQQKVKDQGLWACHLGPDLGGQGYGQLKLALMNEKLGRNGLAPSIFGCQAPDSGNAEIIAQYGTEAQKAEYLQPLLNGDIRSCFSMSEPTGGSDPLTFTTRAVLDGNEWVINGEKWFSTNAQYSKILVLYAVTDPDAKDPYRRTSIFLVPTDTPGVEIIRNVGVGAGGEIGGGNEGYVRYNNVRLPYDALLGERGGAFVIAQVRLGGGRVHHAMRTVGACRHALELMCKRAVSRKTRDGRLADLQLVQADLADSWIELQSFRLMVMHTAWLIDKHQDYQMVRKDIAAIKVMTPKVYGDIAAKAAHLHGALGVSNEMPFMGMVTSALVMGIADGPTEVHKVTIAKQILKDYTPDNDLFPAYHIPKLREEAQKRFKTELGELRDAYAKQKATETA